MEYAILGGGALGLMAAYRLAKAGQSVMVFEQEPIAGGLASGFRIGDIWLEKFYHHIFKTDTVIIKTIEEMGLGDRLIWSEPRTVCLVGGEFHRLDSPATLLTFKPLHLHERLRVAMVAALLKFSNEKPFEGKTAVPWLRNAMGKRAFEMVFEPMFTGKFGPLSDQIALPWFWARFHDRTTSLGYLQGGFQQVYDRLVERITEMDGKVLLNTRVESVQQLEDERWQVATSQGTWSFDRVISTFPTRLTCKLIPALPEDYKKKYEWGQAYGAQCLILALDRQLTDSYWINICDRGYPFTGIFEHTNFRPTSEYGGRHIVYLGNYRPMNDPLFTKSKEELLQEFTPSLRRIRPDFDPSWVQESWLFQAPYAQPIVTTDYREHIPPLDTPLKGLWVANMFQIYPHDRGQNYSLDLANRLIRHIAETTH